MKHLAIAALLIAAPLPASAQAFQGLAADMAMGNLHNELQQRRLENAGSDKHKQLKTRSPARSLAALMVLHWMIANGEDDFPSDAVMNALVERAAQTTEAVPELKGRNTQRRFINLVDGDFKALHLEWRATLGNPVAEKRLSDEVWRSFRNQYGTDLRAQTVETLAD